MQGGPKSSRGRKPEGVALSSPGRAARWSTVATQRHSRGNSPGEFPREWDGWDALLRCIGRRARGRAKRVLTLLP